ncbi:MAG: hypothetical protein ACRD0P_14265 [Stackebrandtia sp.]
MPESTLPTPVQFSDGEQVDAEKLNSLSTLSNGWSEPPAFHFLNDKDRSLSPEDDHTIPWRAVGYNNTTAEVASKIVMPVEGLWSIRCAIQVAHHDKDSAIHLRVHKVKAATSEDVIVALADERTVSSSAYTYNLDCAADVPIRAGDQLYCKLTHYAAKALTLGHTYYGTCLSARLVARYPEAS